MPYFIICSLVSSSYLTKVCQNTVCQSKNSHLKKNVHMICTNSFGKCLMAPVTFDELGWPETIKYVSLNFVVRQDISLKVSRIRILKAFKNAA